MYDLIAINIYGPLLCVHHWLVVTDMKIKSLLARGSKLTGGSSWQNNYNTMCFLPLSTSPQGTLGTLERMPNSRNVEDTCCFSPLSTYLFPTFQFLNIPGTHVILPSLIPLCLQIMAWACPTKNIRTCTENFEIYM